MQMLVQFPVKTLLQDLPRKGPFFLHLCKIMRDLARSCEILWDFARTLCKILAGSCKDARKRTFFGRFCKSIFTGVTSTIVKWRPLLGFGTTKLPWLWLSGLRGAQICDLNLVEDFIELWALELGSECLDGVNYLCLVTCLMQACDELRCAVLRWNCSSDGDG